jgi:hypothetical protein
LPEETPPSPDDKQRDRMNLVGLIVAVLVVAFGIWLAVLLARNLQQQRCELEGRHNCIPLPQPSDQ